MAIGIVSNAFIILATFIIQPSLHLSSLEGATVAVAIGSLILVEYAFFLQKVHRKTLEMFDTAPCKLKLTILRVSKSRRLVALGVYAVNIGFAIFALSGVTVPFLQVGIPYYMIFNVTYLVNIRLGQEKELNTAFEALGQLRSLPRFYQVMAMRIFRERIKQRLKLQLPFADRINPDSFLRLFYLDYLVPEKPSQQAAEASDKLKEVLSKDGDLLGLINRTYSQSSAGTVHVAFDLPWEKPFNWGRLAYAVVATLEAAAALYTLQVFGVIGALLNKISHL